MEVTCSSYASNLHLFINRDMLDYVLGGGLHGNPDQACACRVKGPGRALVEVITCQVVNFPSASPFLALAELVLH